MSQNRSYVALDVGEKRIGVAVGDSGVRIAVPFDTIETDGRELERITHIVLQEKADVVVVGYPRNQSGEATAQTAYVEEFSKQLVDIAPKLVFQDESLTSVLAEQRLQSYKKPYVKGDIDALAAAMILQDFMEQSA
ncbi:MAG: putative Holliday junction resolvase [Candidatus Saccharibacteria bacterium]|jgi:putative Holliday junction resolvase|nr:putative Holliday junction resolvase [Candidatus Saccharibacteria bacterium]